MTVSTTFLARSAALLLGVLLLVSIVEVAPAAADSFYFGVSSGPRHRHHGHYPRYYRPYWGPPRYVYAPPPVIYAPPPQVVYAPPSTGPVYTQSYPMAPGSVVAKPTSPIYQRNGQYCREYQSTVTVNGAPQASYGTACQMPDGAWRIVN